MSTDVTLFGDVRCPKTRFYLAALQERGVAHDLAEVDKDLKAASRLVDLTGSAQKFPTFEIKGRKVRKAKLNDLDKELARAGLYDPGLSHDKQGQRFVRHMAPSDAFVSYTWQGDRMVLGHTEIASMLRGSGLGARFAAEVFDHIASAKHEIRLTFPFLRPVAATKPAWRTQFNLRD